MASDFKVDLDDNGQDNIKLQNRPIVGAPSRPTNRFAPKATSPTSNFLDFGKVPERPISSDMRSRGNDASTNSIFSHANHASPNAADDTAKAQGFGKSRFAAFTNTANADITYVKGVNDEIQLVLSEEMASNSDYGPKFAAMDLARLISKVMVSLNLQPSKDQPEQINGPNSQRQWTSTSPSGQKASAQEMQSTINLQNVMLSELGKSMQKLSKHNSELVEMNKKLITERNNAVQARDDIFKIVTAEREEKEKLLSKISKDSEKKREIVLPVPTGRQYYNEIEILDSAIEAFRQLNKDIEQNRQENIPVEVTASENDQQDQQPNVETILENNLSKRELIQFAADMIAIKNECDPPTSLTVARQQEISKTEMSKYVTLCLTHLFRVKPNQYIRHNNTSKRITTNNFHSIKFQALVNRLSTYIRDLSSSAQEWNRKVLESESIEQFSSLLQAKLIEVSNAYDECLQVLAEEQCTSRQWRLKYEALEKKLQKLNNEPRNLK